MKMHEVETKSGQDARAPRRRFCVRCRRRVDLDKDIGAVELTGGLGVMCGDDVDRLIAEIFIDWRSEKRPATRHGNNAFNPRVLRGNVNEPRGERL
jgi:hypothetical protein